MKHLISGLLCISMTWIGPCSCKLASALKNSKRNSLVEIKSTPKEQRIPFRMVDDKIVITVKVGSRETEANLIVDDGAFTTLSRSFCKKNAIQISDSSTIRIHTATIGGNDWKMYTAKNVAFRINEVDILKKYLAVINAERSPVFKKADGILGIDILSKFNVYINFEKGELILYDQNIVSRNVAMYEMQLPFENYSSRQKTPVVSLGIQNDIQDFIWDMGYNGNFIIQFYKEKEMQKWILEHPSALKYETSGALKDAHGNSIKATNYYILCDTVFIDNKQIFINPTYISYSANQHLSWEDHCNIGIGFMKNYNVFIDWKDKKIYLHHLNLTRTCPDLPNIFAKYSPDKKKVSIISINTNSIPYRNGLRAGDILTSINSVNIDEYIQSDIFRTDSIIEQKLKTATYMTTKKGIVFITQ